jgi:hypothetical protein
MHWQLLRSVSVPDVESLDCHAVLVNRSNEEWLVTGLDVHPANLPASHYRK